jgi:uncharacterized protein
MAREAGLEPLAEALLARPDQNPEQVARRYVEPSKGVGDSTAALEGARAILVERFTEDATLIGTLREGVWARGSLCSRVRAGKAETGAKFADYFEFSEPLAKLPSHLFRGEKEEVLSLKLVPDPAAPDRDEPSAFENTNSFCDGRGLFDARLIVPPSTGAAGACGGRLPWAEPRFPLPAPVRYVARRQTSGSGVPGAGGPTPGGRAATDNYAHRPRA